MIEHDNPFAPEAGAIRANGGPAAAADRRARRARRAGARWHQPIGQELFHDALARERWRADRFDEAFILLLVTFNDPDAWRAHWDRLAEALAQPGVDADVVGWFEKDAVLGVIRPVANADLRNAVTTVAQAIGSELMQGLTNGHGNACSLRLEVYSPKGSPIPPAIFALRRDPRKPREFVRRAVKRALDVVGSAGILFVLAPVFLGVSGLVRLSSRGPVFFRQMRVGRGGRAFTMLKFRTMYEDADEGVHRQYVQKLIQSVSQNGSGTPGWLKMSNDPRVTTVGHYLRRSSLDEIPQFWNVLRGEMSLVGPRPAIGYEVDRYQTWHRRRVLEVKPGITGLWQVSGRSQTTFDDMVRLDIQYAQTWSLWLDLKILLATPAAVLSRRGAL